MGLMVMFLMPLTFAEKREESVVGVFLFLFSRVIRIPFQSSCPVQNMCLFDVDFSSLAVLHDACRERVPIGIRRILVALGQCFIHG